MNQISITLKGNKGVRKFVSHEPGELRYFVDFGAKADYMFYDVGLYDKLNVEASDEIVFEITPSIGAKLNFTGVLYRSRTLGKENLLRLHIVSKYFKGLMGMTSLYGSGNISDVVAGFYAKAGVTKIDKHKSEVSVNNIVFPETTRIDNAITYLMDRATAPNDSYLLSTVVGDKAYIRDLKQGKEDFTDLYYQPIKIVDDRRRVDMMGGIDVMYGSDSEDVAEGQAKASQGTSQIKNRVFSGVTDKTLAKAAVQVRQRKTYYKSYSAILSMIGWIPMLGSNLVVGGEDDLPNKSWFPALLKGKYFINSQMLYINFKESTPTTQFGVQYIGNNRVSLS